MSSSFFQYETVNNKLLKAIRTDSSYSNIVRVLTDVDQEAILLVPQSVVLEEILITRSFIETHTLFLNPNDRHFFVSANLLCGVFSEKWDALKMIRSPPKESNPLADPISMFSDLIFEKKLIQSIDDSSIVVLRQGRARIADQLIQIFLISDALSYDGCDWLMPNKPQNAPNNKSLTNANSQSESALRRSTSDGSMLKNITKQEKKQSPGHQRRVSNSGQLQIDEVMMLFDDEVNDDDKSKTPLFPDSETSPSQERKTKSMSSNDVQQSVVGVAPQRTSKFGGLFRRSTGLGNVPNSPSSSDRHDHKQSASDLVRSIKKFISDFIQSPPEVDQQGTMVRSFINTVRQAVEKHPLWKDRSETELDDIADGLEKHIMNKIYSVVFAPKEEAEENQRLADRIGKLGRFLHARHLDIPSECCPEELFGLACVELNKINSATNPSDKLECLLNCCQNVYHMLKSGDSGPAGADNFLPLFIVVLVHANPPNLHSNIQFIHKYRNPRKMITEAGYYFTQLESAVAFIDILDATHLTIDPEEFYEHMGMKPPESSNQDNENDQKSTDQQKTAEEKQEEVTIESNNEQSIKIQSNERNDEKVDCLKKEFESKVKLTFVERSVESLTIREVGFLLEEYKQLASDYERVLSLLRLK